MQVTVKGIGFNEVERELGNLKNKAGAVLINVLKRVQSNIRKNISKKVIMRYAIKSNEVKKTVKYNKPRRSNLNGSVWVEGSPLALIKFHVKPKDIIKLQGIRAISSISGGVKYPGRQRYKYKVLKHTTLKKSETAFIQKMSNGYIGIFRRIYQNYNNKRQNYNVKKKFANNKIKELHGPSVPQMVGNEEVIKPILKEAEEVYNARITHELNRVLGRL